MTTLIFTFICKFIYLLHIHKNWAPANPGKGRKTAFSDRSQGLFCRYPLDGASVVWKQMCSNSALLFAKKLIFFIKKFKAHKLNLL